MAFINEKLTAAQREEFAAMKIKNPHGSFHDAAEGIAPLYLTIDKTAEMWLAYCYRYHDTDDDIEEFLFMYKSFPLPVQATRSIHLQKVSWKITNIELPKELTNEKVQVTTALTDAFRAYNISGWPGEENCDVEVTYSSGLFDKFR